MDTKRFLGWIVLPFMILMGCQKSKYDFDSLPPTVKSFFTVEKAVVDMGEEVVFTNKSEDADTYLWNFGDGTTSTEKNPTKIFADPGSYTVKLRAIGAGGTGNYSMDIAVLDTTPILNDNVLFFIEYSAKYIRSIPVIPGSTPTDVLSISGKSGVGIAYDSVNKKIYYSDFETGGDGKIWRMNEDGSALESIVDGISDPYAIALNLTDNKVYWADDDGNVGRADLDGGNVEREFIHVDGQLRGLAFDSKNNHIYFYEVDDEDLYIANADGSGAAKIISGAYGYSVAVDEVNGKIYYDDRRKNAVMQANLDGSGVVKIADAPSTRIHGMAIDYFDNKIYWADRDKGIIKRANLDGTNEENFLSNLRSPRGIFIK